MLCSPCIVAGIKLTDLIEHTFNRESSLNLACNEKQKYQPRGYNLWSCQKMCDSLHYILDNVFYKIWLKIYMLTQIVGIPKGINCAPLVVDLFFFCYERDSMLSLSDNDQADVI